MTLCLRVHADCLCLAATTDFGDAISWFPFEDATSGSKENEPFLQSTLCSLLLLLLFLFLLGEPLTVDPAFGNSNAGLQAGAVFTTGLVGRGAVLCVHF